MTARFSLRDNSEEVSDNMKWSELNPHPTSRMLRQFAATWLVLFLVLSARQLFGLGHPLPGAVFGGLGIAVGGLGLIWPRAIRWIFVSVNALAFPVGWLVSQIVLAMMFYLVLTPLAIFFRLRGRDALRRRPTRQYASYWVPRGTLPEARRYFQQY